MNDVDYKKHSTQGALLIVVSSFFYGTYGVWSKLMVGTFGEFTQAWTRALLLLAILVPVGLLTRSFKPIQTSDYGWFIMICLAGGLNQAPYFFGFKHLPIGTAMILFYALLTISMYGLGKLFFNEQLTAIKYVALGLALVGLTIIYRFNLSPQQLIPALCTMGAGVMGSIAVVFSKKISNRYSEVHILTTILGAMLVSNLVISLWLGEHFPALGLTVPWFSQLGYSLAMLCANLAVIAGFKLIEPSVGGILGLLEVIFGVLLGILFFHEVMNWQMALGCLLIIVAAGASDSLNLLKKLTGQLRLGR